MLQECQPQRAHTLPMHHVVTPPHGKLRTGVTLLVLWLMLSPPCSPWLTLSEEVKEALLQGCQASQSSHLAHASCHHAALWKAANGRNNSGSLAHASPPCSPWLKLGEEVEEALLQGCQASKVSHLAHAVTPPRGKLRTDVTLLVLWLMLLRQFSTLLSLLLADTW